MYKRIWFVVSLLLIGGCKGDLSRAEPFASFEGRTVTTLKQCEVWEISQPDMRGYGWVRRHTLLSLKDAQESPPLHGRRVASLPAGTEIAVGESVVVSSGAKPIYATCRVTLSGREPVEAEYKWGAFEHIWPAPWEADVPAQRFVGADGKRYSPVPNTATKPATGANH